MALVEGVELVAIETIGLAGGDVQYETAGALVLWAPACIECLFHGWQEVGVEYGEVLLRRCLRVRQKWFGDLGIVEVLGPVRLTLCVYLLQRGQLLLDLVKLRSLREQRLARQVVDLQDVVGRRQDVGHQILGDLDLAVLRSIDLHPLEQWVRNSRQGNDGHQRSKYEDEQLV